MTSQTWYSDVEGYIVGLYHTTWVLLQSTITTEEQRQAFMNLLEQAIEKNQADGADSPRLPKYLDVTNEFLRLAREMEIPER